jgi:hypothetical protein
MKAPTILRGRLAVGTAGAIDSSTGRMSNVALLTVGEALGRGFYIDQESLATTLAAIQAAGGHLRGYLTHNHDGPTHAAQAEDLTSAASELNMAGFFDGMAIRKDQLVAASFEFFDAFKTNFKPQYDQLVELAVKTPNLVGLSLELWYSLVWVGVDGSQYSEMPVGVELAYDGLPALRTAECFSAAFGAVPAANPGLFAKLSARHGLGRAGGETETVDGDNPWSTGNLTRQSQILKDRKGMATKLAAQAIVANLAAKNAAGPPPSGVPLKNLTEAARQAKAAKNSKSGAAAPINLLPFADYRANLPTNHQTIFAR